MTALEREYTLPAFSELRVVTSSTAGHSTKVLLHRTQNAEGDEVTTATRAEIFGAELLPGIAVQLPLSRSLSVFTPTGCTLTITAPPSVLQRCYATTVGDTWMKSVIDVHCHLEYERAAAKLSGDAGPRALFVSDRRFAGTSTYVRIIAHNAVRLGYHPLLLDGNVEHPQFGYRHCLSLYHLQYTLDVEEETNYIPAVHALVGAPRSENKGMYLHGMRLIASSGLEKMARNDRCRVGGLFLDYGAVLPNDIEEWEERQASTKLQPEVMVGPNPLDTLLDTIVEADINHVFVVQSSWMRLKIAQRAHERFSDPSREPLQMPPSEVLCGNGLHFKLYQVDGLDYVNPFPVNLLQRQRWLQYFFGTPTSPVRPTLLQLDTSTVRIASLGASQQNALSTLMPMMDEEAENGPREVDPAGVTYLTTDDLDFTGRIMAISNTSEMEVLPDGTVQRLSFVEFERRVRQCIIVGFALVESVSSENITLLLNDAPIRKDLGICLLLTGDTLTTK